MPIVIPPADEHNKELVDNVHPPDWINPEPDGRYNLVVIGAGTAGLVTAAAAAGMGAKVALCEKHLMGGDCLNFGCVPSKALIRSARAAAAVRDAGRFGVRVPDGATTDFAAIMERVRSLRAKISHHDSAERFRDLGVDVFLGEASFSGSDTVQVGDRALRFKRAVIATGARAAAPPIPGLEHTGYLTNETVFSLTKLPQRLAVVGAGPIGCELAQCFARFGSQVSILELADQILIREDRDAAAVVEHALIGDGVELVLGAKTETITSHDEAKRIVYEQNGQVHTLDVDEILISAGRRPNVQGMNLDAVGVEFDERTGVKVDDSLRTTNSRIFAAGDVCSRYQFTHAADFQARIVLQNALFPGRGRASRLTIPWCTYTDPEIAHVGLYEHEAKEQGIDVTTLTQPMADVDRAILDGEDEGFVKVHLKADTDRIVGATIVASHAGNLISEISVAMVGDLGLKSIGGTIHPYPTQADAIRKLGDAYNRTRLTPRVKRMLERWLAWTR